MDKATEGVSYISTRYKNVSSDLNAIVDSLIGIDEYMGEQRELRGLIAKKRKSTNPEEIKAIDIRLDELNNRPDNDSERLLKWIRHLVDYPESKRRVPANDVLGKDIVLTRVNEDILINKEARLFIAPQGGVEKRGAVLAETVFEVNILIPNESGYAYAVRTDRFTKIASLIAKILDGKKIAGIGETKVSTSFQSYKVNDTYAGMMFYIITTNSIMKEMDV